MKVRFFTTLRELVGKPEIELEFEDAITVTGLLSFLVKCYGVLFKNYVYSEDGEVRSFLNFLVNGRSVASLEGFETKLKDGDVFVIVQPVAGG